MKPETAVHGVRRTVGTGHNVHTWGRDKFNEPSNAEESNAEHDEAADERDGRRNQLRCPLARVSVIDVPDDLRHSERHDGNRANRHILGRREELYT